MYSEDGVPRTFGFLAGHELISQEVVGDYGYVIALDCSEPTRMGKIVQSLPQVNLNIDHHITNTKFANLNLVDPKAVATVEVIFELLKLMRIDISVQSASALMTGLVTDTLGFRTSNISSKAMRTGADLMEKGADLYSIYEHTMIDRTYSAICYWGKGLERVSARDGIIWTSLSLNDRRDVSYPGRDDADLINVLSSVKEADVAMIFVEQEGGSVKVSWRSRGEIDVSVIATRFGGGGHPSAAGAEVEGVLDEVVRQIVQDTNGFVRETRIPR
jgi:phosphoesterase RecJ-like protein